MADVPVLRAWDEIDPGWVERALMPSFPDARVRAVTLGDADVGTTTRTVVTVDYDAPGDHPRRVFVKGQGSLAHRFVLAGLQCLYPEALLFRSGWTPPIEVPEVYAVGVDRSRLTSVVVMEDVTSRGGVPNVATTPLHRDAVADGLEGLARLHAEFWDRDLPRSLSFLKPWTMRSGWAPLALTGATIGSSRLRSSGHLDLLPSAVRSPLALLRMFWRSAELSRTGPLTLLHGDAHVGNTYELPGRRTGFYDFQLVRRGAWHHDVGYFIGSAMTTDGRRTNERDLLTHYLDELRSRGVSAPSFDDAWRAYRRTPVYGLNIFLQTVANSGYQTSEVAQACVARFGAMFDDLETAAALRG